MSPTAVLDIPPADAAQEDASDSLYELVAGRRIEKPTMSAYESLIASILGFYMGPFALQRRLGLVAGETLFQLDDEGQLQRRPDLAYVSYNRWPEATVPAGAAWHVVPDLAVEIVSPTNLAREVEDKIVEYFAAGVRMVWVIHPDTGRVYVRRSLRDCEVLERTDELSGGDVLPEFSLPIAQIFAALTKP